MTHPEQSVLDAIAQLEAEEHPDEIHELVRWQLEEGRRRGDGPAAQVGIDRPAPWIPYREWFAPAPPRSPAESALAWLRSNFPGAEHWPVRPADRWTLTRGSRSAPGIDTIDTAKGEQPRH